MNTRFFETCRLWAACCMVCMFLSSLSVWAQDGRKVVGVVSGDGEPLIGVGVYEKDTPTNGTITDLN